MDQTQNTNSGPTMNFPMQSAPNPAHGKNLIVIAIIVVVLLLVAGVAYWMLASPMVQREVKQPIVAEPTPAMVAEDDTTGSIENDLNATANLGDLDKEFSELDKDLQGL